MNEMNDFVVVAVFTFPAEVAVIKSLLDFEKIPYFMNDEVMVSIDPLASIAYGGIKLKVHKNDADYVKQLLDRHSGASEMKVV
jgi:hypothetical protein